MANYVALEGGGRCLVSEWQGAIDASTTLISELNPVTSAWVRNTLPDVACFGAPAYLEQMLEHLEAHLRWFPSLRCGLRGSKRAGGRTLLLDL